MKVNPKPAVFLDTSIQVQRVIAAQNLRQQIEKFLTDEIQACTSNYVYMEFQRTVIADYAFVHRILQQESNWGDAIAAAANGQRAFRPRSLARVNRILGETLNRVHLDQEQGLLLLSTYLDYRLRRRFWHQVTQLADLITCDLVNIGVTQRPDASYKVADSCRKETAACHLPDFLHDQRPKLQAIADYLAAHPKVIKDQSRVERLLTAVQANPRNALGQTSCWPLGDIIIALQVPADCSVWTIDSDFAPLATALGIPLFSATLS